MIFNQHSQVPLAKDKVRHVGEPLAVVLAQSRYVAEDALADIAVEIDPLPAVGDLEKAIENSSARVHDDVRANVAAHVRQSRGNYATARARAERGSALIGEFPKAALEAVLDNPWRQSALGIYQRWTAYLRARKAERRPFGVPLRRTWRDWPLALRRASEGSPR